MPIRVDSFKSDVTVTGSGQASDTGEDRIVRIVTERVLEELARMEREKAETEFTGRVSKPEVIE